MVQDCDRQVAEFLVNVAVMNGFPALGSTGKKSWDKSACG
jgi:hypothetical protein